MDFRTIVDIPDPGFRIGPCEEMLFVGSCFATEIGHRFQEEKFRAVVNPYGVMYNPASLLHTIQRVGVGQRPFFSPLAPTTSIVSNQLAKSSTTVRSVPNPSLRKKNSLLKPVLTTCSRPSPSSVK